MAKGIMRSTKTRDGIAAALAYNLGDLEEDQYQIREEWAAQHSAFSDMQVAMEQAGLRVLNRPNLLNQNWWTNGTGVEHLVVYGRAARISGTGYPYLTSHLLPTETTQTTEPTAEQKAAATSIYASTEEGVTTYHIFNDNDDFKATVASLAAADQITETDGTVLDKAINYQITANSAYGNTEWLLYCNPQSSRVYDQGTAVVRNYGQIEEMQPGHRYSLSCWVRVLSGDGVWMKMGYGNSYTNQPYNDTTNQCSGISDWIKVEPLNGAWQRISWTFDYNPVGDWYTETSAVVDGVTKITRTYNWFKKVGFGIGRKYTAQVQVCGFRLVEGRTYVTDTYDDLEEDVNSGKDRLTALEAAVPAAKAAVLGIVAESDTATATANHAVGDLFVMGDVLYKTTAAIATGETITPGTNCSATTLAAEIEAAAASTPDLSAYAPKADPVFTGVISKYRKANTTIGGASVALGGLNVEASGMWSYAEGTSTVASGMTSHAEGSSTHATGGWSHAEGDQTTASGDASHAEGEICTASGNYSHAEGMMTIANHESQHVFGEYNEADPSQAEANERGTYVEIVGKGTAYNARSNARTLDWNGNEWLAGNLTLGNTTLTEAQLQALLSLVSGGLNGTTWVINNAPTAPAQTITVTNNSGLFYFVDHAYNPQYSMIIDTYHDEARIRYVDQYGDSSAYVDLQWADAAYKTITFTADIDTASPSVQAFLDWLHANATQQ